MTVCRTGNVESIEGENVKRETEGREVYIVFLIDKAHCSSLEALWWSTSGYLGLH